MRILHVTPRVSPTAGGPTNLIGLVRGLIAHGIDTTLVTTNAELHGQLDLPLNERVVRLGAPHIFHNVWRMSGRYGFAPSMVRTLWRTMHTYDLVHIHWLYDFTCIAAARVALTAGVPFVTQPHGSLDPHMRKRNALVKEPYMATVGRPLLQRAAAVVFDTPEEARLASYAPRRPEWTMPVGIDAGDFTPLPPRGTFRAAYPEIGGRFLLFLGRLSPQKALDLLLPAFARIARRQHDVWLVIAGPDYRGYESEVRRLIDELGIGHRVIVAGLLTHPMKLAAFIDADLFVLPSYSENFGAVVTEALLCGLPVVVSDRVNIHRELSDAGAAMVVSCSVDGVVAGIESALADRTLRPRIATVGPAFVRARYTWDAIIPPLIERYSEVIAGVPLSTTARALQGDELHG